jgi:hypothetical protein
MMEIGTVRMAQQDGGALTTLAAGNAPGESGVSVLSVRFDGGMHLLDGISLRHRPTISRSHRRFPWRECLESAQTCRYPAGQRVRKMPRNEPSTPCDLSDETPNASETF